MIRFLSVGKYSVDDLRQRQLEGTTLDLNTAGPTEGF